VSALDDLKVAVESLPSERAHVVEARKTLRIAHHEKIEPAAGLPEI